MRVGIDGNVLLMQPSLMGELMESLVDNAHEVYIVIASQEKQAEETFHKIVRLHAPCTEFSVISFFDTADVPQLIRDYAVDNSLNLFIAYHHDVGQLLKKNSDILVLQSI